MELNILSMSGVVIWMMSGLVHTPIALGGVHDVLWYQINLSGSSFVDSYADPDNQVLSFDDFPLSDYVQITAIRWNLNIETVGGSWVSEASFALRTDGGSYTLTPGLEHDYPGFETLAGLIDLRDSSDAFLLHNGLSIELFETFDDLPNQTDAGLAAGSYLVLGLQVPAPTTVGVLGIGLLVGIRRRRF
ncbi:MAG: PEP-CTERM sorting domain-containing protein [Phycisphaerales bacterium]